VFLDIGANVGAYSFIAASIMKRGTVLSVEPSFSTFKTLCDNILHLQEFFAEINFIPFSNALNDEECILDFKFSSVKSGAGRHGGSSCVASLKTGTIRLDALVKQFNLPNPTIIKIDVDGPELNVIRGASQTLANKSLRSVLIEVEHKNSRAINQLMNSLEFQMLSTHSRGDSENRIYIRNS
jgi:FkbM family methyltransferase